MWSQAVSTSDAAHGIILAHGSLAEGLSDAVGQIAGNVEDALVALSNRGRSPNELVEMLRERLGPGPTILFTDLPSGSCTIAARRLAHEVPGLVVVSGVNLPILLDFMVHRRLPLHTLVPRLLERGRKGIESTPKDLEDHGRRALSSR